MIQEVKITKREQQVLELISLEYTSDEIAQEMFISTHTAHTHRKNLLNKLEAKNTAGLVRKAFECKLLPLSCILLFLIWNQSFILAQEPLIDVEGDSRMRGVLDINYSDDTSSVYIGRNAYSSLLNSSNGKNTFVGSNVGSKNQSVENSFFGFKAGEDNEIGNDNSFFGASAGKNNVSGYSNSFFGEAVGALNTEGYKNSFFGRGAGLENINGNQNSFFGKSAGYYNKVGSYNTFIGADSGIESSATPDSLDRAIAIGYNAKVKCHNCAVIGGTGEDAVKVGIGTKSPNSKLHVEGDNGSELLLQDVGNVVNIFLRTNATSLNNWQIKSESHTELPIMMEDESDAKIIFQYGQDSIFQLKGDGNANLAGMLVENSDSRLKKNIVPMTNILNRLMLLSGYTYNWIDPSKSEELQIGLLAQEVQAQFPELVQESDNGRLSVISKLGSKTSTALPYCFFSK